MKQRSYFVVVNQEMDICIFIGGEDIFQDRAEAQEVCDILSDKWQTKHKVMRITLRGNPEGWK